uniref:beta-N-acetylhexosaminidase n=2 Tax=Palpitomonas bilix TaxID=652834 RepID=A0A7S3D390_9EUKA|mmetsp:Transcript_20223/g.51684  ORF Transcript_20223/g.51684 Transcript_20223/m.51684 type:complete len:162 (+) Transcript_20223:189-674(+)
MKEKGIPDGDGLLSYFVGRVHKNIAAVAPPLIQYQEVFEAGFRDSNAASNAAGTIFHVWKASSPAPADAIQDITAAGYRVVVSNSNYWYLNEGFGRLGTDTYTRWEDVYEHGIIDNITLTSAQKDVSHSYESPCCLLMLTLPCPCPAGDWRRRLLVGRADR